MVRSGAFSTNLKRPRHVRFTPDSNRTADIAGGQVRAMKRHRRCAPYHCQWSITMNIYAAANCLIVAGVNTCGPVGGPCSELVAKYVIS